MKSSSVGNAFRAVRCDKTILRENCGDGAGVALAECLIHLKTKITKLIYCLGNPEQVRAA
jgi:hypothetical protein